MDECFFSIIIPNYSDISINQVICRAKQINDAEIIVIESGKPVLHDEHKDKIKYKFFEKRLMPGGARNEGAKLAKGKYILFLDSDVMLTRQTLEFLNGSRTCFGEEIVFGCYTRDEGPTVFSKFQNNLLHHRFVTIFKQQSLAYGQSSHFIIRRDLFKKVGGFNTLLRMREDTEFCFRAQQIGVKNVVSEKFTGKHLKQFSYFSLHRDYFLRTFYSIKAKVEQPKIFGLGSNLISKKMFAAFTLSCFGLIAGPSVILLNELINSFNDTRLLNFTALLFVIVASFLSPVYIVPEVFRSTNIKINIVGLLVFPSIFLMMILGGLFGLFMAKKTQYGRSFKSVLDWLFLLKRVLIRNGYPIQIIQFATARCNLRCVHCFYKESLDAPNPGELDKEIFKQLAEETKPLLWYAFAGGEVFIRKDFPELYDLISKKARPKIITIPTNGWYVEKVYNSVLSMLQNNPFQSIIIQLSIDGTREIHDKIRGEGSYDRAIRTFERLKVLRNLYPCLQLAFITVVTPDNRQIYPNFVDELLSFDPNQININLFRYGYLDHPPLEKELIESYKNAVEYYESLISSGKVRNFTFLGARAMRLKEIIQKELIYKVASTNEFVTPCTAGTLSYVVWEDGKLGPCEILTDTNFNITEQDLLDKKVSYKQLFKSKHSQELRNRIVETKCKCTYECAMSNNTFFSWPMTGHFMKRYVKSFVSR